MLKIRSLLGLMRLCGDRQYLIFCQSLYEHAVVRKPTVQLTQRLKDLIV